MTPCQLSQVGLVSQFVKQMSLDLDKTWSKNQTYHEDVVV